MPRHRSGARHALPGSSPVSSPPTPPRFSPRSAPTLRAVVTGGGTGVSPTLFDALPQLGIIAINGIGTDAVDLDQARRQGVRVTTTPGILTDDVADITIALMLAVSRQLARPPTGSSGQAPGWGASSRLAQGYGQTPWHLRPGADWPGDCRAGGRVPDGDRLHQPPPGRGVRLTGMNRRWRRLPATAISW